jgi:hypothetical protein
MIDKNICHPFEGVHLLNGRCHCFDDAKIKQALEDMRYYERCIKEARRLKALAVARVRKLRGFPKCSTIKA